MINKIRTMKNSFLAILLLTIITSCQDKFNTKEEIRLECQQGTEPVRKVLFIGIDGVRTDALLAANTPCIDTLMQHAYYNLHTDRGPFTVSVPGWSSILHGVWPAKHGLTKNAFDGNNYENYPDIFALARESKPNLSLVSLSNWSDFLRITTKENYSQRYDSDHEMKEAAKMLLQSCTPDMMVLHFDAPDAFGHDSGFTPTNKAYLDAIQLVDMHIQQLMDIVKSRESQFNEEWMVVLSTDHGGNGTGHGGQDDLDETRFVWCILRQPQLSAPVILSTANSVDLLPSMLKWMNIEINPNWDLDGVPLY